MQAPFHFPFRAQNFWLSPARCLYWENRQALVLSDLHFGKSGHFRKSGIAVPQAVYKEDLQRLLEQIQYFQPRQIIVVGDMFHSHANKELDLFLRWRNDFPAVGFHLVMGNHDILSTDWYAHAGIEIHRDEWTLDGIRFRHDGEAAEEGQETYTISGHIHPGIAISGTGRQKLRFPCFYFAPAYAILPAFSRFTGLMNLRPGKEDRVLAIVEDKIMAF